MSEKSEGGARTQTGSAVDSLTAPTTKQRVRHTPGPWTVRESDSGDERVVIVDESGKAWAPGYAQIALVTYQGGMDANARLIAAAPELLDIAKRIAAHFQNTDAPLGAAARAAIAKAEGR